LPHKQEIEMRILDDWPKFLIVGFLSFAAAWGIIVLYELARGVNPYSLPDQERKAYRLASAKASLGFAVIILLYKIILSLR
jgi:hypothetical protein